MSVKQVLNSNLINRENCVGRVLPSIEANWIRSQLGTKLKPQKKKLINVVPDRFERTVFMFNKSLINWVWVNYYIDFMKEEIVDVMHVRERVMNDIGKVLLLESDQQIHIHVNLWFVIHPSYMESMCFG